jgi:GTP cyclohydrolase I
MYVGTYIATSEARHMCVETQSRRHKEENMTTSE